MRKVFLAAIFAMLPFAATGEEDPIDRTVTDSELSPAYSLDEKSHHQSNREFTITSPNGSAQDAIGTRFARGGDEFEILSIQGHQSTYDSIAIESYNRVIYLSKKLEQPHVPPPPKRPIGRDLLVVVDYRPVQVHVPPPAAHYEAYIAEVELGSKKTQSDRWEFIKVTGKQ